MAFIQYLNFDGTDIPLPESYDVEVSDVVSDAGRVADLQLNIFFITLKAA